MRAFLRNYPYGGVLIDLGLILLTYVFHASGAFAFVLQAIAAAPISAIGITALLQTAAFGASALLLFVYRPPGHEVTRAATAQSVTYAILMLPVIFGPQWTHIPRESLVTEEIGAAGGKFGEFVLFLSLMGVYAAQIALWINIASNDAALRRHASAAYLRPLCVPVIGVFLMLAEMLVITSVATVPSEPGIDWFRVLILTFSYLPTRLFLVFRPPFRWLEMLSALTAFSYLLVRLDLLW